MRTFQGSICPIYQVEIIVSSLYLLVSKKLQADFWENVNRLALPKLPVGAIHSTQYKHLHLSTKQSVKYTMTTD